MEDRVWIRALARTELDKCEWVDLSFNEYHYI